MMRPLLLVLLLLPAAVRANAAFERRLYADRADSSSFLWNDWNKFQENYLPLYAADGDPMTAWVEGAGDSGEGEWIRFYLSRLEGTEALRLRVQNGYQKSTNLYKANARPQQIEVKLLPSGMTQAFTLEDQAGWQELRITQPRGRLEAVELKVVSVYAGSKYTDLAVSDVEFYATSVTPDNPAAEKARYERVLSWKKDRVAAAAVFKASTGAFMPVLPRYTLKATGATPVPDELRSDGNDWIYMSASLEALAAFPGEPGLPRPDGSIARARAALTSTFADFVPVQVVTTDSRPLPVLDNLQPARLWTCYEGPPLWGDTSTGQVGGYLELPQFGKVGFLRAETVGVFDVKDNPSLADAMAGRPSQCSSDTTHTFAWAQMAPAVPGQPARAAALLTVSCGMIDSREGRERAVLAELLSYDEAGYLDLFLRERSATSFGWRGAGAGAVLSQGRRVGAWTDTVRMSEVAGP